MYTTIGQFSNYRYPHFLLFHYRDFHCGFGLVRGSVFFFKIAAWWRTEILKCHSPQPIEQSLRFYEFQHFGCTPLWRHLRAPWRHFQLCRHKKVTKISNFDFPMQTRYFIWYKILNLKWVKDVNAFLTNAARSYSWQSVVVQAAQSIQMALQGALISGRKKTIL